MNLKRTRKRYNINYHEVNMYKQLKESMFMLFLQDVATVNADENGFGYDWLIPNRFGWFLLKYRIEFSHYPKNMDYIEIETFSRGCIKLFAMRDFIVYSPQNEIIGKVASTWALMDMQNKSMISPQKVKDIQTYQKEDNDLKFNKIILPEYFDFEKNFEVRFDDIDINCHANNTNYISWALEPLPQDFRANKHIKNIDMQFKKEIKIGEIFSSKVKINSATNETIHLLKNAQTNDDLCYINITWE